MSFRNGTALRGPKIVRPHLYPLPLERIFSATFSGIRLRFANPVASIAKNAGSVSPSLGGEGRGEDGSLTNFRGFMGADLQLKIE
jgi:hypothetical protein